MIVPLAMKRTTNPTLLMLAFSPAILSACAGSGDRYPSLAIRDAERRVSVAEPTEPPAPVAPVASAQEISAIVAEAREANAAFREAQPGVRRLAEAARGLDFESNAYSNATAAVATLSALRGQTVSALGRLDELETEAAAIFAPTEDIRSAQAEIEGMVIEQSAALEAVSANLAR